MSDQIQFDEFKAGLRGALLESSDPGYDEARKVYNGMINKHPRMIVKCADVADVIRSVNFARDNGLLLAVRGGGHSVSGMGVCNDGLVIDLSRMNYTRVDLSAKTVVAGGGCTLADVDHATHVFGMATPSGIFGLTGVGGLTLGGGFGHFTRKYGLAIDNLLSVDMVLANGTFVTASADQNQDLFWAVRGGGGNFGVITAFTFRLHPIDTVYAGPILYDISESADVLKWYRKLIHEIPDELSGFFAFLSVPPVPVFPEHLHLKKVCGVIWTYSGPLEKAEEVFKPIRAFKAPLLDGAGPIPQPVLQTMFDQLVPKGFQHYWRADFLKELSDEAIALHVKYGNAMPTPLSSLHLYPVNGAASRIPSTATAYNYRDAIWNMVILGMDPDPANNEKITAWTKEYWEAVHPYSAGGAYINFLGDEGEDRVRAAYGKNYDRLVTIKNKYDPGNLFRVNQNIKPSIKAVETV
jgi:FAD/FMN-containing dehydrogenase